MRTTLALAMSAALAGLLAGLALGKTQGPVIENLGAVVPTPAPTPEHAERIRMITSFTLQNKPDADSIISFEATDLAKKDKGGYRIIATELYSLAEPKPEELALRDQIIDHVRDLERELLKYVMIAGPPREREPVTQQGGSQRPR